MGIEVQKTEINLQPVVMAKLGVGVLLMMCRMNEAATLKVGLTSGWTC